MSFQLDDPGVSHSEKTLAILSSKLKMNKTLAEIKLEYLEPFVEEHEDWCKQVASFVLGKKKRKWQHYKNEWLIDAFPLDEIGITFFARCFRKHICVFVNTHLWTTHIRNDPQQCSIFLAYHGGMMFDDTRPMTTGEYCASSAAIGRMQAKFDEAQLREEADAKKDKRNKRKRPHISSDEEEDLDLEQLLEDKPGNNMQNFKLRRCSVNVKRLDEIVQDEVRKFNSGNSQNIVVVKNSTAKKTSSTEPASVKPKVKNNMQKFKDFHKKLLAAINARKSSRCVLTRKCVLKAKRRQKDSWSQVTSAPKLQKKRNNYKCPDKKCKSTLPSKAAVRRHLKEKHPSFRWKCRRCQCSFATHIGRYKHELKHKYRFRYSCNICVYRCMFESEMQEHTRKHSQKCLYKCRVDPDCGKRYPAKRTRNAHEQTHSSEDWTCHATLEDGSLCGQECVSKNHLAQHIRGLHGWDSHCGKNFKWPSSKYKHEQECTTCTKIKSKEKKKLHLKGD